MSKTAWGCMCLSSQNNKNGGGDTEAHRQVTLVYSVADKKHSRKENEWLPSGPLYASCDKCIPVLTQRTQINYTYH